MEIKIWPDNAERAKKHVKKKMHWIQKKY